MRKTIIVDKNTIIAANELVKNGVNCACHCPISLALNQQTDFHGWFVSPYCDEAMTLGGNRFELPKSASIFLKKWVQNKHDAAPFSFDIPYDQATISI